MIQECSVKRHSTVTIQFMNDHVQIDIWIITYNSINMIGRQSDRPPTYSHNGSDCHHIEYRNRHLDYRP